MDIPQEILEKHPSFKKMIDSEVDIEDGDGREERLLDSIYNSSDLASIRGHPAKVLAAMDHHSSSQDFLISIGPHKAGVLQKEIERYKPRVLVEIGGYMGYSAIAFAEMMRAARPGEKVQVFSLEFKPLYAAMAMSFVDLAGMSDVVRVVTGPGADSLKRLKEDGTLDHIDFLFIDHIEDLYVPDLKACQALGLLKSGACIAADNVVRPGAPEYRKYVRSHPDLVSHAETGLIEPGGFHDEIEITIVK